MPRTTRHARCRRRRGAHWLPPAVAQPPPRASTSSTIDRMRSPIEVVQFGRRFDRLSRATGHKSSLAPGPEPPTPGTHTPGIGASASGAPSARMKTPSTGLPCLGAGSLGDRCRHRSGIGHEWRNEDRDDAVDVLVREDDLERAPIVLGGRRREHVDGIVHAGGGREERPQR